MIEFAVKLKDRAKAFPHRRVEPILPVLFDASRENPFQVSIYSEVVSGEKRRWGERRGKKMLTQHIILFTQCTHTVTSTLYTSSCTHTPTHRVVTLVCARTCAIAS